MTFGRVRLNAGFVLLWALLVYFDDGGWVLCVVVAAALHELGHWVALRCYGRRVTAVVFAVDGVTMRMSTLPPVSWSGELLMVLAGPVANLLLAGVAMRAGWWQLGGVSLALAVVNLLPAATLDGGRALGIVAERWWGERAARVVQRCGTVLCLLALLGGGVYVARETHGRNLTLLCMAVPAVLLMVRRNSGHAL